MIARFLLAAVSLAALAHGRAQTFQWAAPIVGGGVGKAVAVDAEGNVYSCGNANGPVDFDPGPGEALTPPGTDANGNIYVVKYDAAGNYLWHYTVGGSSTDIAKNVAVDGNGDVLVTGYFSGNFDWDPGPGVLQPPLSTNYDCFVLKLSSAGQIQWVQRITGPGENQDHGLAVDTANNVYVTGSYSNTVSFGDGAATLAFAGGTWDAFYAKYGADGGFRWARSIAGTGFQRGLSVACAGDRLYLYGTCSGLSTANGTHSLNLPSSPASTYLCKTDTAGNVLWLKSQSATGHMSGEALRAHGTNVYLFASFRGTVDADPGDGVMELVPSSPTNPQVLFAKLDSSGNAIWARQLHGNIHFDCVGDIAVDDEGGVAVTCATFETEDYDPGPGEAVYTPVQPNDLFTARYTADGAFLWVRMVTTGETFDTASGTAVDQLGNVYMTGSFGDSAVFDPGPLGTLYTPNSSTAFTVKYGVDLTLGLAGSDAPPALQLMPNPARGTLTILGAFERGDAMHVFDAAGRQVMSILADDHVMQCSVQALAPGAYTLVWMGRKGRSSERFVVE